MTKNDKMKRAVEKFLRAETVCSQNGCSIYLDGQEFKFVSPTAAKSFMDQLLKASKAVGACFHQWEVFQD